MHVRITRITPTVWRWMSLLILKTSEFVSGMECGQPGKMPVDVVSKSFPDVVKVVQKLVNTVFVYVQVHRATSPPICGVTWSTWEFLSTASAAIPGPNCDLIWFSPSSDLYVCARAHFLFWACTRPETLSALFFWCEDDITLMRDSRLAALSNCTVSGSAVLWIKKEHYSISEREKRKRNRNRTRHKGRFQLSEVFVVNSLKPHNVLPYQLPPSIPAAHANEGSSGIDWIFVAGKPATSWATFPPDPTWRCSASTHWLLICSTCGHHNRTTSFLVASRQWFCGKADRPSRIGCSHGSIFGTPGWNSRGAVVNCVGDDDAAVPNKRYKKEFGHGQLRCGTLFCNFLSNFTANEVPGAEIPAEHPEPCAEDPPEEPWTRAGGCHRFVTRDEPPSPDEQHRLLLARCLELRLLRQSDGGWHRVRGQTAFTARPNLMKRRARSRKVADDGAIGWHKDAGQTIICILSAHIPSSIAPRSRTPTDFCGNPSRLSQMPLNEPPQSRHWIFRNLDFRSHPPEADLPSWRECSPEDNDLAHFWLSPYFARIWICHTFLPFLFSQLVILAQISTWCLLKFLAPMALNTEPFRSVASLPGSTLVEATFTSCHCYHLDSSLRRNILCSTICPLLSAQVWKYTLSCAAVDDHRVSDSCRRMLCCGGCCASLQTTQRSPLHRAFNRRNRLGHVVGLLPGTIRKDFVTILFRQMHGVLHDGERRLNACCSLGYSWKQRAMTGNIFCDCSSCYIAACHYRK